MVLETPPSSRPREHVHTRQQKDAKNPHTLPAFVVRGDAEPGVSCNPPRDIG